MIGCLKGSNGICSLKGVLLVGHCDASIRDFANYPIGRYFNSHNGEYFTHVLLNFYMFHAILQYTFSTLFKFYCDFIMK